MIRSPYSLCFDEMSSAIPARMRSSPNAKANSGLAALSEAGIEPEDLALRRPTLDEVFLHLIDSAKGDHPLEVAS